MLSCMSTCVYSCICNNFWFEDKYSALHMVHGNTYLHMYGSHLHMRTMIMMMLWVTMGMYVSFVSPSLTMKRCSCVDKCQLQYCTDFIDTHTHTHSAC